MVQIAFALSCAIIFGAIGDLLLSNGMQARGEISVRHLRDIPHATKQIFTNPVVLLGVLSMSIFFGSYLASLTMADVSVVNPLTALSYLIASAWAYFVWHERIRPVRFAGIALIVMGAILVGLSSGG